MLPDVAVPTATATGWSVRSAGAGGAGELCYLDGSYLPFAKTKAEREATGDGRLSLEERYHGPADYAAKVHDAAVALAEGRLSAARGRRAHHDARLVGGVVASPIPIVMAGLVPAIHALLA